MRLRFADGTSARVFRETTVDRGATLDPCVLVVEFRLRAVRGRGHAVFRRESLLNTPLFAGFPGLVSKLWLADDERGRYRGCLSGIARGSRKTTPGPWRVLALVSVRGSIHYVVLPALRRGDLLAQPQELSGAAAGWWHLTGVAWTSRPTSSWPARARPAWPWPCRPTTTAPSSGSSTGGRKRSGLPGADRARPHAQGAAPAGVTQALLARSDIKPAADLQLGTRVSRVTLAGLPLPGTAFPHLSLVRQMDVEQVLAAALAERGVDVERGTELVRARDGSDGVRAVLQSPAGTEEGTWPGQTARSRLRC